MACARETLDLHGLRCTRQRELILESLQATRAHPTAEELFHTVRAAEPGLSLATVYNTLEALAERGLVKKLSCPTGAGPCRFDAESRDHVHIALPDGRLMDAPLDLSERLLASIPAPLLRELEAEMGVAVSGLSLQIAARAQGS